jgi:iron(III) transport system permease protein
MNLVVALNNIDSSMEESAQNLGASGMRLFRRIVFPLAMPGYVAGAALVFIKVFDDLGTPLVLNQTNMLAPQAYLRITSIGIEDPIGYVASVIMVAASLFALWASTWIMRGKDYATLQRGYAGLAKRRLNPGQTALAYGWITLVLLVVLAPHIGILLLSFAKVWSFSVVPESYTLAHYATVFQDSPRMIWNTVLYCGIAATLDVLIATAIAYIMLRTRIPGRQALDFTVTIALAIPGVVLGIGYLRTFRGIEIPFTGELLTASWVLLALAYTVRRLPYALRSCVAALQQMHVSLEEAAENLGASKGRTIRRIVVPLMAGGMLAGFIISFMTAAVELSTTIMLVTAQNDAPMSYGIYLYMQSAAGRGPGAALGVLAVVLVALGTYLSHRLIGNRAAAVQAQDLQRMTP